MDEDETVETEEVAEVAEEVAEAAEDVAQADTVAELRAEISDLKTALAELMRRVPALEQGPTDPQDPPFSLAEALAANV